MKKTKVIKGFDCVEMKRKAQAEIYRETKHMSSSEKMAYIHAQVQNGPFGAMWHGGKRRTAQAA